MAVTEKERLASMFALKRKFVAVTAAGVLCLLIPVVIFVVDPMFLIGRYNFRLENGTILHEILKEEIECGRFEVYMFNITNADRFVSGEDYKLKLEEIGPFTYIEYRLNEELVLKDGVMKYTPKLRSVFVPEESVANPEDLNITMPNIPMLAATALLSKSPFFVRTMYNMMVSQLKSRAIVTKTAYDYLWGYHEPVLSFANKLVPGMIHFETTGLMDRMYDKNAYYRLELGATYADKFSVKSVTQYRVIKSAGQETISENTENFTNTDTYEGIAYPPKLDSSKPVNIYRVGICRSFPMTAFGRTTSEYGPDAVVYEMNRQAFRSRTLCNSKGFCPNGLMDMSSCFYGLPLALSKGHFLDGDPELYDRVEGLSPDKTLHDSHLVIEPKIGLTLETALSLQVNIVLGDIQYSTDARRFSDIVLPIAHFKIKQPRLPEIAVTALTLMYITMPKVILVVNIISFILGIALLSYSIRLLLIFYYSDKVKSHLADISAMDSKCKVQMPLIEKLH